MARGSFVREPGLHNCNLREAIAGVGINRINHESLGTAHEWLTWRRHLRRFALILFKD